MGHLAVKLITAIEVATRTGLANINSEFECIYQTLEETYEMAERCGDERIMGGVIGIMVKMCVDGKLLEKLCSKGMLGPSASQQGLSH